MEYRSSEVKAGFFIFVSLVTLVAMIFVFGNLKEYFQTRKALPIVFNFTGGLEIGAPVRYAGLDVGRVSDIQLQDTQEKQGKDRVVVITQIDPDIQIKKNSTATIKTSGLMGGLYIDIRPGTSSSPPLETGQTLQGQDSFEFTQIGDMMEEVVLQVRRFLDLVDGLTVDTRQTLKVFQTSLQTVNEVIGDNKQSVQENLENLLKVSRELSHLLENNRDTIHGTLTHLASITEKADSLITDKNAAIIEIIDQTHRLTRELELLLADNRPSMTNLIRTMEVDTKKITSSIDSAGGS
ncbi:MAG: MCE family protein, partial [Nitrospinaceae bacterium]|nr:MCE family protein [Nitrospinaceae bacterium]NIR56536.1 MCE family protein [Nitrospinaceae bacterium]NIS86993.1 MCE family protein [Nitrospinaceae bacterium]NIT83837.1 MCE family protein [Nitrospinaceae bacterium]NIU46043.1 MCE family protein [Nitrospinaceae bacterium]